MGKRNEQRVHIRGNVIGPLILIRNEILKLHGDIISYWSSLVAQTVKCLSTMRETWVRSLGREDSLEKETATHSSILA